MAPVNIFISYSHIDKLLRAELEKHLSSLKYQGVINTWCDGIIDAGDEWDKAVKDNLEAAKIILLLISADFIHSKYIREVEIKRALARHNAGEARVIPIILRNCLWDIEEFSKLKALPEDDRAVTSWPNHDDAFTDIARGIKKAIENDLAKFLAGSQSTAEAATAQPNLTPPTKDQSLEDMNDMLHQAQISKEQSLTLRFALTDLLIPVYDCRFSHNGKQIVSALLDGSLIAWEAQSGRVLYKLIRYVFWDESQNGIRVLINGHKQEVRSCDFSPAGKLIVSASTDTELKIWDTETGNVSRTLEGHEGTVNSCCFSLDGGLIVSASSDRTVKVWDVESNRPPHTGRGHLDSVNSCAFDNSRKRVVSASADGTLKVWSTELGKPLYTLSDHSGPVNSCSLYNDGKKGMLIVSASDDHTLKVWNADSRELVYTLEGHSRAVNGCSFSPDGKFIASVSSDYTVKVWNAHSYKCLATFYTNGDMFCCAMYEDMIVAGGALGLYFLKLMR